MMNDSQMKTSPGEAEVFVLSPNILEKLGINLCNIAENKESSKEPKKKQKNKHSLNNVPYTNHEGVMKNDSKSHNNDEMSSILETANLMKKSVFLSPTFTPTVVNAIPGEVEIANDIETEDIVGTGSQINGEIITKDNNFNTHVNSGSCTVERHEDHMKLKETDTLITCNGNGVNIGYSNEMKEDFFSNGTLNNNLNPDVAKLKAKNGHSETEDMLEPPVMNNNVQSSSLTLSKRKQDLQIVFDSKTNSNNANYQATTPISTSTLLDYSVSLNSNIDDNNIDMPVVNIDTIISNQFNEEALVIPISELTKNVNENCVTCNVEDINILDVYQSVDGQDFDNKSEIDSSKQEQKGVIPISATEIKHTTKDIIIDIINYTECEESSDMEIDNMLRETELLIPVSTTTEENKFNYNQTNDIDKELNQSNTEHVLSNENESCDEMEENRILISILPELTDSSNLSRYIDDTQNINLDIFYEHNNEIDTANLNTKQKLIIPIPTACESIEGIQVNVNKDTNSHIECNEASDTSDMELDNILRDTEILIPVHTETRPSELITINNNEGNVISSRKKEQSCEKYEQIIKVDVENVITKYKDPLAECSKFIDDRDSEGANGILLNSHTGPQNDNFFLDHHKQQSKKIKDQIIIFDQKNLINNKNDYTAEVVLQKTAVYNKTNLFMDKGYISATINVQANITCNAKSIETLDKDIHKQKDSNFAAGAVNTLEITETKLDKTMPIDTSNLSQLPEDLAFNDQCKIVNQPNVSLNDSISRIDTAVDACNRVQSEKNETVIQDKVKEIAEYLKQVYHNSTKKRNNKRGVKILKPKAGILTKSKVYIQGVEKPGGSEEHKLVFEKLKIHKTYEIKKKEGKSLNSSFKEASLEDVTNAEQNYTDINMCINPNFPPKRQEFCLCGDFGKFTYVDDYDNFYEHIHFVSKKSVNCSADTVFEIYNENNMVTNTEDRLYIQEEVESSECDDYHICWQKFEYQENIYSQTDVQLRSDTERLPETDLKNFKSAPDTTIPKYSRECVTEFDTSPSNTEKCDDIVPTNKRTANLSTGIIVEVNSEITQCSNSNTPPDIEINLDEALDSNPESSKNTQKTYDHGKSKKRKIEHTKHRDEPPAKKDVKCGVCQQKLAASEWEDHISTVHCYIAWKDGQSFNLDNLLLMKKLKKKLQSDGRLVCICAFENIKLENFLSHVKKCVTNKNPKSSDSSDSDCKEPQNVSDTSKSGISKCGVCQIEVDDGNWVEHMSREHQYLAWKDGEPPLDISDEDEVKRHLLKLVSIYGHLICTKCGLLRKYTPKSIKSYLTHIKECCSNDADRSRTSSQNANKSRRSIVESKRLPLESSLSSPQMHKCAVCEKYVEQLEWYSHICEQHDYRAWKDGENAPDFEDEDVLWQHLHDISKRTGGLQCSKCGLTRKYVKPYLHHLRACAVSKSDDGQCSSDVQNSTETSGAHRTSTENERNRTPVASTETDVLNSTETPKRSKRKEGTSMKVEEITCGVCNVAVSESSWFDHIGKEHNYIAWRDGESPLNSEDTEAVWNHLHNVVGIAGKLICAKCGKVRKYPKVYLQHMSECQGSGTYTTDDSLNYSVMSHVDRSLKGQSLDTSVTEVKCGVCQEMVGRNAWIAHIQTAHSYIAWIDGETPLDSNNHDMIREHLQQIVDEVGTLICAHCGTSRKYAKKFYQHMTQCSNEKKSKKHKGSTESSKKLPSYEIVSCGVCQQKVQINQWINHIRITHNYVAWRNNQSIIRMHKNASYIQKRLQALISKLGVLLCPKCEYESKDGELFLQHTNSCKGNPDYEADDVEATKLAREGLYQCAICLEKVKYGEWEHHSVNKHYNMAWVVGDEPIDVMNQNSVMKYMNEYLRYSSFVCKVCGLTRSSGTGFFAHIISCGLSEEEADRYKITCDICGVKYPGIYKSQHMTAHTQQELTRERRERAEEDREREKQRKLDELAGVSGRRRAAEKARMVIEEIDTQFKHVCQSCAYATDAEDDMASHKCLKKRKMSDELDLSQEHESSDEEVPEDVAVDDNEQDEVDSRSEPRKRPESSNNSATKIIRIPFVIPSVPDYLEKYVKEHSKHYLTTETLFPEWIKCDYEAVLGDELHTYMPPLEESCKVHANDKWRSYKRWEAAVERQKITLFTGACIQRIAWWPSHIDVKEHESRNILAVACHSGADCPQYEVEQLPEHQALIQFWDFGNFKTAPKMVFGLALQYGTVWAMDWCPSGACETLPENAEKGFVRMGLLAVACSNGYSYIFSVPYPSSVMTSDTLVYKLKPVAQLKFTMKSDRKLYQATSVCWTTQKGHATVVVGYADGSTAFYDLNTESPFLKSQTKDVTIFYPFYDEHTHNTCVTDMSSFPVARASSAAGAVSTSSLTGSALSSAAASARGARPRSHLASSTAMFLPAWPSVLLAGEDFVTNMAPSELEYFGAGRRMGFMQTCCGCPQCALVATYMAPFLRVMRPHHARSDLKKQVVAWITAKQFGKKRKLNEDKAAVGKDEPRTYEDAVTKYGIEFKLVDKVNNEAEYKKAISQYKEINPERFPISNVPSMAFCPSAKHHKRLAVATHAGLIFVLNV